MSSSRDDSNVTLYVSTITMKEKNVSWALIAAMVLTLVAVIWLTTIATTANAQNATSTAGIIGPEITSSPATTFTAQKTAMSTVDTLPGHSMHQAVVVLPQRTDGKIWVGTISWSASKPVELRLLQNYNTTLTPDAAHGKPVTAPFSNGESAISLLLASNGAATVPSYYSGSMDFAASQVAFHTLGGLPFTVTYTIDATAKSPSG
jgi:hypothetical protein